MTTARTLVLPYALLYFLILLPHPTYSQVSFPLTAFPAWSTIAPCATGHIDFMFNTGWWSECSSDMPIKSYGSCICAYQKTDVDEDLSEYFSAAAECSTSGVSAFVTQLCSWGGVDLAKDAAGAGGAAASTTATATETGTRGVATGRSFDDSS